MAKATAKKTAPKPAKKEIVDSELGKKIDALTSRLSKVEAENKELKKGSNGKEEKTETKKKGIILQMIDANSKPIQQFVKMIALAPGEEKKMRVGQGSENAHVFTEAEADELLSQPGHEHYIKVKSV